MNDVQLNNVEMWECWVESDPTARWKVGFPLTSLGAMSLGMVYMNIDPGQAVAVHQDSGEEVVVVLVGNVEAWIGDAHMTVGPGGTALIPAMVSHRFRNVGTELARIVGFLDSTTAAATFEEPVMPFNQTVMAAPSATAAGG